MLLTTLDLLGVFVCAVSGATRGIERNLDVFGICVLAFATACAGGIIRDLLIGATPPAALLDWRYLAASLFAAHICFFFRTLPTRFENTVLIFDAIGLGFFAVSGTQKALETGKLPFIMAALLGMITAIGGGIIRDLLTMRIPLVLQAEIYALAALAGALVVAVGSALGISNELTALFGGCIATSLRLLAIKTGWNLPKK